MKSGSCPRKAHLQPNLVSSIRIISGVIGSWNLPIANQAAKRAANAHANLRNGNKLVWNAIQGFHDRHCCKPWQGLELIRGSVCDMLDAARLSRNGGWHTRSSYKSLVTMLSRKVRKTCVRLEVVHDVRCRSQYATATNTAQLFEQQTHQSK